jgi:ketosteroid isomerase-like protein
MGSVAIRTKTWGASVLAAVLMAFALSGSAVGQVTELSLQAGVPGHAGVDAVYRRFSEAYRTLNVDLIADQYTQTAAYLVPGDDVVTGRDKIRPGFLRFFDAIRNGGQTMTISFDILQRKVDKNLGYDVGIYTLRTFKDGREINVGRGKFVVVTVKEKDGKWRFQVDGYNDLKQPGA